jgi:hypothetical protein
VEKPPPDPFAQQRTSTTIGGGISRSTVVVGPGGVVPQRPGSTVPKVDQGVPKSMPNEEVPDMSFAEPNLTLKAETIGFRLVRVPAASGLAGGGASREVVAAPRNRAPGQVAGIDVAIARVDSWKGIDIYGQPVGGPSVFLSLGGPGLEEAKASRTSLSDARDDAGVRLKPCTGWGASPLNPGAGPGTRPIPGQYGSPGGQLDPGRIPVPNRDGYFQSLSAPLPESRYFAQMYHFYAPSAVKSIKLAGTIELYIPTKDPASIITASLATEAGKPLKNDVLKAEGVEITLRSPMAGNSNSLSYIVKDPKRRVRDVEIVDAGGRILADRMSQSRNPVSPDGVLTVTSTVYSTLVYDFRLMPCGDGSGVPTSGKKLAILGIDNNGRLHIRSFDADGKRMDTDETKFPQFSQRPLTPEEARQAASIAALKSRIPGLLPPHLLTRDETSQLQRDLTPILDQTATLPADAVAKIYVMTEKSVVTVPFELKDIPTPEARR